MMSERTADRDNLLELVVRAANAATEIVAEGEGASLVLTINGQTIIGELISNWQWAREMAAVYREIVAREGRDPEDAESEGFGYVFKTLESEYITQRDAIKELQELSEERRIFRDAVEAVDNIAFIHLKNARIYAPGQVPLPANGMYWRGRISQVDGWTLGGVKSE